jgi:hypothetical protein
MISIGEYTCLLFAAAVVGSVYSDVADQKTPPSDIAYPTRNNSL